MWRKNIIKNYSSGRSKLAFKWRIFCHPSHVLHDVLIKQIFNVNLTPHTVSSLTIRKVSCCHTAVVMKNYIFWDTTPCSLLKVNYSFGGRYRLHLHGRRINQSINQHEECNLVFFLILCSFLIWLIFITRSSERSVYFQWTTRRYFSEGRILEYNSAPELRSLR
jgi:hypothetical protein